MHEHCEMWNLLHDGVLDSLKRDGTDLHLTVSIPYLAGILQAGGEKLSLVLHDCSTFEYTDWETEIATTELSRLQGQEILSTDSESLPARIHICHGDLLADFAALSLSQADGTPLSIERLRQAATSYWDEFSNRNRRP